MSNVLITQGTQSPIKTDTVGTEYYQYIKLDVGAAGASVPFTGTFLGGTLNAGTVNVSGTLQGGTINLGTVDSVSQLPANWFGTTITTGTNTLGTIKPLVSGSAIFVTDLIVSVGSATTLVIGMGGTSTPLIGTLSFNANSGIVSNFRTPGSVTSGSALVYQQSVGCPMSITVNGFVR